MSGGRGAGVGGGWTSYLILKKREGDLAASQFLQGVFLQKKFLHKFLHKKETKNWNI